MRNSRSFIIPNCLILISITNLIVIFFFKIFLDFNNYNLHIIKFYYIYAKEGFEKKFTNKDFRFTYKNGYIYAFQMRPNGKDAVIKTLKKKNGPDFIIKNITLLSTGEKLEFERSDTKLTVKANSRFSDSYPICFKIEID